MDAISALAGGMRRAEETVGAAAQRLASADLPTAAAPDVTRPVAPAVDGNVDVADQLTTLMVAADAHHLTTAAVRAALDTYRDAVDIIGQQ